MDIEIEPVTDFEAAFPAVAALMEELHDFHEPLWPRPFLPEWLSIWKPYIALTDGRLILLAKDGAEPVGLMVAAVRRNPALFVETFVQLEDAYVRASHRRAGLGAAMVERVETWARARGVGEVRLGVVAANGLGLAFWEKSGFKPLSYQMTKTLAAAPS